MPRTHINLTYVCVMPCNMCYSCRQHVHLFIPMISPGDQGCKSQLGVGLHPAIVTTQQTPWRWLMPGQQVEGKEKWQNQWHFIITFLIPPQLFQELLICALFCLRNNQAVSSILENRAFFFFLCFSFFFSQWLRKCTLSRYRSVKNFKGQKRTETWRSCWRPRGFVSILS